LCQNSDFGVCNISGACYGNPGGNSNYDKNNWKTWNTKFRENERTQQSINKPNATIFKANVVSSDTKKRKRINLKELEKKHKKIAMDVITKLLYSPIRENLNTKTISANSKENNKQLQLYISWCEKNRQVFSIVRMMMIDDNFKNKQLRLEKLKYDELVIRKYTTIIMETYRLSQKYVCEETFKFEVIALGVLYEVRQGFEIDGIVLCPSDCFFYILIYLIPIFNLRFNFFNQRMVGGKNEISRSEYSV